LPTYICCFIDYSLPVVSNATWEPTYELHATTENGKPSNSVALHYRARVTQSTGEDWNDTLLTLSTVTGTTTKAIPKLRALKLHPLKAAPAFNNVFQKQSAFSNNCMSPFDSHDEVNFIDDLSTANVTSGGLFGTANNVAPGASSLAPGEKASGFQSQQAAFGSSGGFGSFGNQSQQRPAFGASLFGQQIPQPQQQIQQHFQQQQQQQVQQHFQQQQQQQVQQQSQPSVFGQPHQPQPPLFGQSHSTPGPSFYAAPSPPALAPQGPPIDHTLLAQYQAELASADGHPLPDDDDFENVSSPSITGVEPTTVVAETPIAISYSVHGESTIPSDDVVHQVVIAVLPFEATISYISVPRIEPRVYLQVRSIFYGG
jgi:type II secretory pathway pseudopilin PulG